MRPVPHFPRVSCCTLPRQNPGNCTENPPSSRPCRGWPDCLAADAGRSEPVSSPRCGFLRTVLTFYNRTWPDLAGLGRTWEGGSLQLEHLLESEEDNEIEILPNGEIRAVGGSDPAERGFKKPLTMREDLGGEYGARRRVGGFRARLRSVRISTYGAGGWRTGAGAGPTGGSSPSRGSRWEPCWIVSIIRVRQALAANRGAHAEAAQRPDLGACRRRRDGARAPHRQGRGRRDVGGLSGSGYLRRCLGGCPLPRDGRQASPSAVEASYLGITGSSTYEAMSS